MKLDEVVKQFEQLGSESYLAGKRHAALNKTAISTAEQLAGMPEKPGQWNAKDALRELTSERLQERLGKK